MTTASLLARLHHERRRAQLEGIGRDTLPTAREGQLDGYIAGLNHAILLARTPNTPRQSANTPPD